MGTIDDDKRAERTSIREWRVILPIGYTNYNEYVSVNENGITFGFMTVPWAEIDEARRSLEEQHG